MNQNRKKVLIVGSHRSVNGGITSVINNFLDYDFEKYDLEMLSTYIEGSSLNKTLYFFRALIDYCWKIINNKFDIVHIHMSYKGSFFRKLIIIIISKLFRKPVILHLHGSEFKIFYDTSFNIVKKLIRYVLKKSDVVITLGKEWEKIVHGIEPKANIKVFRNAVSIPDYKVEKDNKEFNIVFLGVIIKRKGIYELIEAINKLKEMDMLKEYNIKFLICGSGIEEKEIKDKVNSYKLNEYVKMMGWINEQTKIEILKKSQLLVLPSYNEGLPMAILEAMSYGIPVISTDVGSIAEVVNEKNGVLIRPKSCDEIVRGIKFIINNIDNWDEYSKQAKRDIIENFNERSYFLKFERLYDNMVK